MDPRVKPEDDLKEEILDVGETAEGTFVCCHECFKCKANGAQKPECT